MRAAFVASYMALSAGQAACATPGVRAAHSPAHGRVSAGSCRVSIVIHRVNVRVSHTVRKR